MGGKANLTDVTAEWSPVIKALVGLGMKGGVGKGKAATLTCWELFVVVVVVISLPVWPAVRALSAIHGRCTRGYCRCGGG